jgi:hypothetical protein
VADSYSFPASIDAARALAAANGRTEEWGEYAVTSDLFAGDFGDGSERTLADHLTITKRAGVCRECDKPISKGEIARVIKMVDSEGFYGGRVCVRCLDEDYAETHGDEDDV